MSGLDSSAEVSYAILVTFRSGASFGTVARYTSFMNALVLTDGTFAPEPSIEVTMNAQGGGSEDTAVQLRMLIRLPLDTLTSQRSHSPVRVEIEEIDPTDSSTRRMLFAGLIATSTRNLDGKTGIVQVTVAGWRYALAICSNAWLADTSCNNTFGDAVCRFDVASVRETATISAINGNVVTLSGLTTTSVDGYWRFGYLTIDGLQILIRDYGTGSDFTLLKTPPPSWVGQTVVATPGCDKQLATCRGKWDNEPNFTGFGFKIPAYNPILEST